MQHLRVYNEQRQTVDILAPDKMKHERILANVKRLGLLPDPLFTRPLKSADMSKAIELKSHGGARRKKKPLKEKRVQIGVGIVQPIAEIFRAKATDLRDQLEAEYYQSLVK